MIFIAMLFYVYCIIGAIVGGVCWMQAKWPVYMPNSDKVVDDGKTLLFALFCGPLFWISGLIYIIFRRIIRLVN